MNIARSVADVVSPRSIDGFALGPHPAVVVEVQGVTRGPNNVFRLRSGDHRVLFCTHGGQ